MATPPPNERPGASACVDCNAPLAADQRYCLECGARVGALPNGVAAVIGRAEARASTHVSQLDESDYAEGAMPFASVAPRAAALAVMALLAFGVVVGSSVSPAAQGASAPLVVAVMPTPQASAAIATNEHPTPSSEVTSMPASSGTDTPAPSSSASDGTPTDKPAPATSGGPADSVPSNTLPAVKHVFMVVLSGHGADEAFGAGSPARYLAKTLRAQGEFVNNYYGVTQGALANEIALVSGQGPTSQTAMDCPQYGDVAPGTVGDAGQVQGDGCVYPAATKTVADQLEAAHKTWKAYVEDIDKGPAADATTCRHPTPNTADNEQSPRPTDAYVSWRNPFIYFHSLLDGASCAHGDVGLSQLAFDLTSKDTTPAVSYIVPNRCHDGVNEPCAPGQPAGLAAADAFLKPTVEQIQRSPAYKDGGLIAITFDQAPGTGAGADTSSCCTTVPFPNLPSTTAPASTVLPGSTVVPGSTLEPSSTAVPPGDATPTSDAVPVETSATPMGTSVTTAAPAAGILPDTGQLPGGGRTGLLLLSQFVKPGTTNLADSYNHFSLLRSIEDLFGLDHLGYAADPAMPAFDKAVYNANASN